MKKSSVCVLVVTYNRKKYLVELIKSLMQQTYPIKKILVFDNYSDDGTAKFLYDNKFIDTDNVITNLLTRKIFEGVEFIYYRNSENSGGSGGFHDGLRFAHAEGCDYIWAMDDDVLPKDNCLEELMNNMSDDNRICIANRSDGRYEDKAIIGLNMTNPFKYNISKMKTYVYNKNITDNVVSVVDMPFEGPLIDNSIIQEIGLPKKELFIFFDDTEYALRASKVTDILFVKEAILHKQIIPAKTSNQLMGWKDYYSYRNQYWFIRHYGENIFVRIIRPRLNHIDLICRSIVKRKWSNLEVLKKAFDDGMNDRLGKRVEPGTEFYK